LNKCIFSSKVNIQKFKNVCRSIVNNKIEVKALPADHILHGEFGVFAKTKIKQFDIISEYVGVIKNKRRNKKSKYLCKLWSDDSIYPYIIDSYKCGNETRFINCYINISTEPNVIFKSINIDGNPRIFLLAKKDIEIGEEILSDYGKNYCKKFNIIKK
jgi:SET domain-containing protein